MAIPCVESRPGLADLYRAQGIFLTNSVAGVWPVRRLDDRALDPSRLPRALLAMVHREALTAEGDSP